MQQQSLGSLVSPQTKQAIAQAKARFIGAAERSGLDWRAESMFALQTLQNNDYLQDVAEANPWSLTMAMINVAAIGITLNPARQLAFLVPRDGRVLLDISYRGLIQIGKDEGAIVWAKAEIVRENDTFVYQGMAAMPDHRFNPFDENRGEMVGAYCAAKLPTGDILVEPMRRDEILQIRNLSKAYVKRHAGPWVDFPDEMTKKTVIKRGSKTWPGTRRLDLAIDYLNREAGEGLVTINDGPVVVDVEATVVPESPQFDETEIPEIVRNFTRRLIERATTTGLWHNAREVAEERAQAPHKDWVLQQLKAAQMEAERAQEAAS